MPKRLQGVLPIVQTPFLDSAEIDFDTLAKEVEWGLAQGIDGLGTGMVSELLKLTAAERQALAEHLVQFTSGRAPVFMGVGAESSRLALEYARTAERAGCDAVMATPPMTGKCTESGLVDYFRTLADGVNIPLIVQDASGYVGQSIPMRVYIDLLDRYGPEKILFKPEASPVGPNLSALRDATGGAARIFEGSGGIFLIDSYRRGIAGTMPGIEVVDGIATVWQAMVRGDEALAYRAAHPIGAMVALQLQAGLDGFLTVEKHLLVKRGLFSSPRRRGPYGWELDRETAAEVDRLYDQLQVVLAEIGPGASE
jgi:4-hydroxy-tetrahydrodipicolinate synthase